MLRIRKREDYILLLLIVAIILATLLLFFKNNDFNTEDAIQIERSSAKEEVLSQVERIEGKVNYQKEESKRADILIVQLGGAVQNPGVYKCQVGERIYQLLKKAGGVSAEANLDSVNLVDEVKDGQKVIIPANKAIEETSHLLSPQATNKVNINTASKERLEQLKGVGPSTAEKIIEYRKQQGGFSSVEELTNVPGIGPKTLEKLKSQIAY
ncbi:competence protein ComEA [Orenia metallireducens]|jgi:competence protein ComEA|uniref:Competence protein ComEA n=1 Tax=Orenia metallireducens TaxID=1413210 RepID=A0A285IAX2_9FIRM|nr:helix-hairpin-helix domain-containing protein [Orenia metallireducens]PRX20608.1 competence protein ComEA [Orenia metallireducens]SNY45129.1 competence protein ComEA [Orenia metallireducens]